MDPDETLKIIRAESDRILQYGPCGVAVSGLDMAEAFKNLDEWLSKGGFPPKAWTDGRG